MSATHSSRNFPYARLACAALGICLAFLAAWFAKSSSADQEVSLTPAPQTYTPFQQLDLFPVITEDQASAKALAKAIASARNAPEQTKHWISIGDALAQIQRETEDASYFAHAERAYKTALKFTPNSVSAMTGMAWVTGGRHEFAKSIEWATQALAVDPECVEALGILGDATLEMGDYDATFTHYQKMMDLRPDLSSWSRGAHLLWITGQTNDAIVLMGKAIRAGGPYAENTAWCRAKLATMHYHSGALLAAEQAIQPCLDAGSHNRHVLQIAAQTAAAKGDYTGATQLYQKMLEKHNNVQALIGLGELCEVQENFAAAEDYYQKAEALHKENESKGVHEHTSMAKFFADHNRQLLQALRIAEEHKLTKNVYEADTLAWVYLRNNQIPKAVEAMKIALSQNTPDPEIHYHAGMIAYAFGDKTSARTHLVKALNMNPNFHMLQAPRARKALEELKGQSALPSKSEP